MTFETNNLTDHFFEHRAYMPVYEFLLAKLKMTSDTILEIGNASGGMLLVYREYFPNATVIGVDPQPRPETINNRNIVHLQRDAFNLATVEELKDSGPFALIVDDATHFDHHQAFSVEHYSPLLAQDGLLIVEDVYHASTISQLKAAVRPEFFGFAIDLAHINGQIDDRLFVVARK